MFDDFLHQLVSGSLPSWGWRFNVGEHWKPWERCRTEGTRDQTHGRVRHDLCECDVPRRDVVSCKLVLDVVDACEFVYLFTVTDIYIYIYIYIYINIYIYIYIYIYSVLHFGLF